MIFFIYSSNDISSIRLSACLRLYQTNEAYTQRCQSLTTKRFHTNYIVMFSPSSALWSFCTSVCVCEYVFFPPFQPETPPCTFHWESQWGSFFFILLKTLFIYQTFSHIFQQARGTRPSARHQSLMMRTGANDDVECSIITRAITRASTANNTN
jgi:hypothetical protein